MILYLFYFFNNFVLLGEMLFEVNNISRKTKLQEGLKLLHAQSEMTEKLDKKSTLIL